MAEMQMASLSRRERNFNQNVGTFSSARQHSEKSRWICLYPCYLNSKKSEVEGRKIPIAKAVENPTINEIKDVLMNANFKIEIEANKSYPRETNKYENRGRIRIQLKNDDGTPINEKFKTRKSIFLYVAETIPKLKTRGSGAQQAGTSSGGNKKNKKNNA